jgi:hypothetical protein
MANNETIFDEIDDDTIDSILLVKKNILGSIKNKNAIIDLLRDLVDETNGILTFVSKNARNFILSNRPSKWFFKTLCASLHKPWKSLWCFLIR